MKKPCRFKNRCSIKDRVDESTCFDETYCGVKEGFMNPKELKQFRKKHNMFPKEKKYGGASR